MKKPTKRSAKVADLIWHQLALLIKKEVADPRLKTLSITAVDISPDLSTATIFYTLLEPKQETQAQIALKKAAGFLRHALSQTSTLRHIPKLFFQYDNAIERAEHMVRLLENINPKQDP